MTPALMVLVDLAAALVLGSCASTDTTGAGTDSSGTAVGTTTSSQSGSSSGDTTADTVNPPDAADVLAANATSSRVGDDEWDASSAQDVTLTGSGATTSAEGVTVDGSTVTVTAAGVYRLSGELDGQVVVDAPDDALVVLVLDGVDIANSGGSAIEVVGADDGLRGKDSVTLEGGTVDVTAGGDGVKSDRDDDSTKGFVHVAGGSLTVDAQGDGISATTDVVLTGGTVDVSAGESSGSSGMGGGGNGGNGGGTRGRR